MGTSVNHGRFEDDPALVKAAVFRKLPGVTVDHVARYLTAMAAAGLIIRYVDSRGTALCALTRYRRWVGRASVARYEPPAGTHTTERRYNVPDKDPDGMRLPPTPPVDQPAGTALVVHAKAVSTPRVRDESVDMVVAADDPRHAVLAYWADRTGRKIISPKVRALAMKKLATRLKDGYTPAQLCQAVDGAMADEHYVRSGYLSWENIWCNSTRVEKLVGVRARAVARVDHPVPHGTGTVKAVARQSVAEAMIRGGLKNDGRGLGQGHGDAPGQPQGPGPDGGNGDGPG